MKYILIFLLMSIIGISQNIPKKDLIGWWEFNDNTNDLSGYGNDGEVNGAKLTSDRFGEENSAYYFDGIYDYIKVDNLYIEPFILRRNYTISFWILINYNGKSQTIISKGNGFSIKSNESLTFNSSDIIPHMPYNAWTNIVCVFTGNTVNTYQNGILIHTQFIDEFNITNTPLVFGAEMTIDGTPIRESYFNGKLDQIGIWSRPLNQEEIQKLYNLK